ncbi:exodeoxyribonuclease I [Chromobacterium alticapitis]|uniref:Exodeoxyribonuclease I n=1 Tax=Chromobacterium alticapitis TaxID=2073169 RepID=A0A2S5DC18_9NEIS|nr:exodeoxyribonuclease I [Chromobacterium alticapitis]POZ60578.1 exodeoxyribonuclease I [Chromobacterium alticapitis]
MSNHTFFWHDYETFGAVPRRDRPSQFAGIRTDAELNEIGEPVMLYCRPSPDYLPTLQASLLTGITPQRCQQRGVAEHEFAGVIERELAAPATIGVGYNSLRFDDEVTRFLFWRNLIDPYAREWQNHCGRWDLLDLVRATYALRPDGIVWPQHEDGRASFKLEHLSAANGLAHESAHDALSDVRATIALARLIRQRQPKLFDYYLTLRKKDAVKVQLSLHDPKPVLHVSGMYGVERGNLALVWPLAAHPTNGNEVIVWDLAHDPSQLRGLSADDIRQRLFSRADELPEGLERLPIKTIHINKSPFIVSNLKVLGDSAAARWGMDLAAAFRHAEAARGLPDLSALWRRVYQREAGAPHDVDENLYGGFVSNNDRKVLQKMRRLSAAQLAGEMALFEDPQLAELLFRYRARNFPDSLSGHEQQRWRQWCGERVAAAMPGFLQELAELRAAEPSPEQQQLLQQVADYAANLQASPA